MSEWRAQTQSLSFVQKDRIYACFSAALAVRCQCAACQTAKQCLYPPDTRTHTRKSFPHFNGSPLHLQTSQRLSADHASSRFFVQSPSLCFFSYSLAQGFWLLEVLVTDLQASPLQLEEAVWTLVRADAKFNFTLMKMSL